VPIITAFFYIIGTMVFSIDMNVMPDWAQLVTKP